MKNRAAVALGVLLAAALAASSQAPAPALSILGKELEPLRADFNRDAGRVRLLLLLDPT